MHCGAPLEPKGETNVYEFEKRQLAENKKLWRAIIVLVCLNAALILTETGWEFGQLKMLREHAAKLQELAP
jgi:hypothetical protein